VTDGPFKNLCLGSNWKRLVIAVQYETGATAEHASIVSHALVRELTIEANVSALKALEVRSHGQLDLDPIGTVDAILDAYAKTPFLDTLQKQLRFQIGSGSPLPRALPEARNAAIEVQIRQAWSRINEEFIYALNTRAINQRDYVQALHKISGAFEAIDRPRIQDAICKGNKNAFNDAVRKKKGLEEGPPL
jgi:hypothetical protein